MIGLMLLEIISIASFLFSGFMLFISFAPISHMYLIFIWTVFSTTIFAINSENSAIYQASTLLLFAPLIFYHDITGIFFILTISVILIVYVKKSILRINHNVYVNKL